MLSGNQLWNFTLLYSVFWVVGGVVIFTTAFCVTPLNRSNSVQTDGKSLVLLVNRSQGVNLHNTVYLKKINKQK